jgi:acetyltransferase-like isoleucine patch superfamily enzyme
LLIRLYGIRRRRVRDAVRGLVLRLEGGEFRSLSLRAIFKRYYDVEIGLYTHGGCFKPGAMDRFTTIGRYGSIASDVRVMNRNHPMEFKSTHAFFFNPRLGLCREDRIEFTPLTIGNDVWIGHAAKILVNTRQIGDGAVIGSGAVVNKDVPPYAVVVGNPSRVVRFRFPASVIQELLAARWWDKPVEELDLSEFTRPYAAAGGESAPEPVQ